MTTDLGDMKRLLGKAAEGQALDETEAETAFDIMMSGDATPSQMGGLLMALRVRGETVEEITGAARTMRAKMHRMEAPANAMDVVGTGGDASGTYNVSTGTAFVVAGCGVPVAKHGNRAFSSKSGSADVLSALGVNLDADFELIARAIREAGIGFMMAPRHHGAMRHVGGTRVELGTRTVFNILGPLCNPAGVKRLLVGTFADRWLEPMARVLGNLGAERAWVVHAEDGLDEISLAGPTHVATLEGGKVGTKTVTPQDAGLQPVPLDQVKGGDPEHNAEVMRAMLDGAAGPFRDFVRLNAAAALIVAGRAADLKAGAKLAAEAIDSGRARAALDKLVAITNSDPAPTPDPAPNPAKT
jgi:anthranilate phosphoribosyltransferase